MSEKYTPTWMVDAIYQLTPENLKSQGIKVVLTDLDNTLIAWNNPDGTKELHDWLDAMSAADIVVMIVSNNKAERIARIANPLGLNYVSRAFKPLTRGLNEAVRRLQVDKAHVVMVGDQLLTDIWAANNFGIRSILVKPLIETDQWNTKINRFFEKGVKKNMLKSHPELTWRTNLD